MTAAAASLSWPSLISGLAKRPALALFALCLCLWLPGALSLPPLDRDESRFAQASKQMIETADYVDIRFLTGTRYNKPVGIYWLQAASTKILGAGLRDRIWTYRVPSLIGGYLALLLVYWCTRSFARPETALAASALLGASVLLTGETQIATTDAVLLAATLGAQAVLFRLYLAARDPNASPPSYRVVLAGWFALGVGVLVKGPVTLAVVGLTALAVSLWDRDWRWLKQIRAWQGLLVIALVDLPWLIAIAIHSHGAFYKQSLGHDFASKLVSGQESHGAPPGYYLAIATLTLWPAVLFVLPALYRAWRERSAPAMRYLLAWAATSWLMVELVPTKLPQYVLPAFPALAILAAVWIFEAKSTSRVDRVLRVISAVQFAIGVAAFTAVAIFASLRFGTGLSLLPLAVMALGVVAGLIALIFYARGRLGDALLASIATAMLLVPVLTAGIAPNLDALWVSPRAAALVAKARRPGDPPPIIAGYVEPSLIFLLGTQTQVGTGATAAAIAAEQGGLVLVEDREREAFLGELGARDTEAFPVDAFWGYNYSHGRKVHMTLYRVAAFQQPAVPPAE